MRWRRQNGEMIAPDVFIPIAESSGLIIQLTQELMNMIEKDASVLFRLDPDFHISLNISEADLHSEKLMDMLLALIQKINCKPQNLVIEATERKIIEGDAANRTLSALRNKGFKIAIDDFGTGYSSLSYLESLEVDYLKIDKSFVNAIGTEASTSHVIFHIIEMAKSLQLKIVAEGVETQVQLDYIRKQGVQFAQGWLLGKPIPLSGVIELLMASSKSSQL